MSCFIIHALQFKGYYEPQRGPYGLEILVIDDHPLIRSGISAMLLCHDAQCVIREASDCGTAIRWLIDATNSPDLILLDLNLSDCSGLAALAAIREAAPCTPVVVLSAKDDRKTILDAFDLGAMGFIPKTMSPDLIWSALGLVLAGGVFVPHTIVSDAAEPEPPVTLSGTSALQSLGLTVRQIDTLRMLVQGLPNKSIARNLGIAEATVKAYISAVLRAMNVTSRTQAVIWLSRNGVRFDGVGANLGTSQCDLN